MLEKIIDNILDRYYSKRVIENMKTSLAVFNCDKKVVKTKRGYELHIKNRKYKDDYWKVVYKCNFNEGLDVLIVTVAGIETIDRHYIEELLK